MSVGYNPSGAYADPNAPGYLSSGPADGKGNQALNVNAYVGIGGFSDLAITTHGSDWYFAVCAIMGAATVAFMAMSFSKPRHDRIFHYITAAITMVACIAYFSMGSGLGQTPIIVEYGRPTSSKVFGAGIDGTREIFWVRYVDWFVTTPLLLLDLLLTSGLPWPSILITILADEIMIVTGLVGALTSSTYKWGYFTFAMVAFFYVVYSLVFVARSYANALAPEIGRVYMMCGVLTVGIWFLYPIAWGVSEGGNLIHPDSEAVFYGILDIIAKPIFGTLLIIGHRNITAEMIGLRIHDYTNPNEKSMPVGTNGYNNGVNGTTGHHNGVTGTTGHNNGVTGTTGHNNGLTGTTGHNNGLTGHSNGITGHNNGVTGHNNGVTGTTGTHSTSTV